MQLPCYETHNGFPQAPVTTADIEAALEPDTGSSSANPNQMILSDRYIDRVKDLPPAPTIATELLGLFEDPNCDLDRMVNLISHDPALTARVLKGCNSTFFGGAEPATDMFEAITRLGLHEVYYVVVALAGVRTMSLGKEQASLDVSSLWQHSVTVAVAAKTLARRVEDSETVAFTAGLLHDIGKLVFAATEDSRYAGVMQMAGSGDGNLRQAEQAFFGASHTSIGMRLLTRWGLPENIAMAVQHHHGSPLSARPHERLAATVHLANHMAHHLADQTPYFPDLLMRDPDAMNLLKLSGDDIPGLVAQTRMNLRQVQGLFHVAF